MSDFLWEVALSGHRWGEGGKLEPVRAWPVRQYAPLEDTGLFRAFADTEPTEEGILAFANQYGMLGASLGARFSKEPEQMGPPNYDQLHDWQLQIQTMQQAIAAWQRVREGTADKEEVQELQDTINHQLEWGASIRIVDDPRKGGMALEMRPFRLHGALWLQLAQAVAADREYRTCGTCGRWFALDPATARSNRLFCSQACRSKAYRGRKEEAQRLAEQGKTAKEIAAELGSDAATVKKWIKQGKG